MKKYSFLVHHADHSSFLEELQNIGVVHIREKKKEVSEETQQAFQLIKELTEVKKFLQKRDTEAQEPAWNREGKELMKEVNDKREELESLAQQKNAVEKQIRQVSPWGDFSEETIEKLKQNGVYLHFFVSSEKRFQEKWKADYNLEIIAQRRGEIYFVILTREGKNAPDINAEEIKRPEKSLSQLKKEKEEIESRIRAIHKSFDEIGQYYIPLLERTIDEVRENAEFKYVVDNSESQAQERIKVIEGYVPQTKEKALIDFLEEQNILYLGGDVPKEEMSKTPVLLKNDKFTRTFESIGSMFSLPNYKELDLTPFFAPFFMMFFGFCLGDAGYGILFLIVATIYKIKSDKPNIRSIMTMIQYFGIATVIFGILTGTVFGVQLANIEALSNFKEKFVDNQELFNLALIVGGFQIIFGMCLKIANKIKQQGFKYAVSTLGWVVLIVSSLVFMMFLPEETQQTLQPGYYAIAGISGATILFFNNPDKNILVNFGTGLWDVYNTVVGVFGDFLSYIRLFAIGLSTAVLGYVFNQMALTLSGDIPVVRELAFVLILLIGHGINIFMSSLGSLVHPMRLIFVEFFGNAGFKGGGKAYKPFTKIRNH